MTQQRNLVLLRHFRVAAGTLPLILAFCVRRLKKQLARAKSTAEIAFHPRLANGPNQADLRRKIMKTARNAAGS